jgi:lysophospholipase L1-like esterase
MSFLRAFRLVAPVAGLLLLGIKVVAAEVPVRHFRFDAGPVNESIRLVTADDVFSRERGYGFEPGLTVRQVRDGVAGSPVLYFTTALPDGNWKVKVTLRGAPGGGLATVKAELRRLMIGPVPLAENEKLERAFIVNTRTPRITQGNGIIAGAVKLKEPRESVMEAWAWDERLTLEIDGAVLSAVEITPAQVPTVFLIGDSTVCDQPREPYNSWGQMLPRFFKPTVAVANHGESGETYRDSIARRRLDKIIGVMRPGDYLFMQFGHNDQKQIVAGNGGPFTTYKDEMKTHIAAVRRVGGIPVVISPMERRQFDSAGKVVPSLADYARASREVSTEEGVAFIDLNAMSRQFYEVLGPEKSARAFAAPGGKVDNTHHNNYGSYELARCIARGIGEARLELAHELLSEFAKFDPLHPDDVDAFSVPPSPNFTNQRPLGD